MGVNIDKIQDVIESEVDKAITGDRKRIITLLTTNHKELIDEIKSGGDSEPEEDAAEPVKLKSVKPGKAAKSKPVEQEADGNKKDDVEYDISEVEDEEANECRYADESFKALKAECKKRNLYIPKGYQKLEILKLLVLHDEDQPTVK